MSEKDKTLWSRLLRRRRISIFSGSSNEEVWHTNISPINLIVISLSSLIVIFALVLTLVSYSPLLEILPGYSNKTLETRRHIIESVVRIDSMERVIKNMMLYSENVSSIMNGRRSEVEAQFSHDTLSLEKGLVAPNSIDSALRVQMEQEGRYSSKSSYRADEAMITPVDGVVSRHFDISKESFGIEITVTESGRIVAARRGVVVMTHWTPSHNYIIEIVHPDNSLSIYRNIESATVKRGDEVKTGEVIGYNDVKGDHRTVEFEIWSGGRPINPQRYILF